MSYSQPQWSISYRGKMKLNDFFSHCSHVIFYILKHIVNKISYFSKIYYHTQFRDHLTIAVVRSHLINSHVRYVAVAECKKLKSTVLEYP
jgi:hypothetical protein